MIHFKVPATTANLGPGFDVLGLALQLYDEYTAKEADETFSYHLKGADAASYGITSNTDNMVYRAFAHLYQQIGKPVPGVEITCQSVVPICRGLGSSAAATVAGLISANKMAGNPLGLNEILQLATELEGHPDNVAPALFGGLVISLLGDSGKILYQQYPLDEDLTFVLAVPNFTLETKRARAVLPKEVSFHDAIFNMSRVALLVSALTQDKYGDLQEIMEDRLHQPYRQTLIPGFAEVKSRGLKAGAYGVVISGAGPTILAISSKSQASRVGQAMVDGFLEAGISANTITTKVHNKPIE